MYKVISCINHKEYMIISLEEIKNFLRIISSKDDDFLKNLYFSAIEYAEDLTGLCLGQKQYIINYYINNNSINLAYNQVKSIDSCYIIRNNLTKEKIEKFIFLEDTQSIYIENDFYNYGFSCKSLILQVSQNSFFDQNDRNFEKIKTKILTHIDILYKNRNEYISDKVSARKLINNLYHDLVMVLR